MLRKKWRIRFIGFGCVFVIAITASAASDVNTAAEETLKAAASTKDEIALREREITQLQTNVIAKIESALSRLDVEKFNGVDNAIQSIRPLVHQLNTASKQLLANQDAYFKSLRSLHAAVLTSPEAYRAASRVFEGYAADEPYEEIKKDYLVLADSWRLIAEEMERRGTTIKQQGRDAVEFKKHLERTSLFLERLETHLSSYPEVNGLGAGDEYTAQLQRYIQGFESLRGSLRTFHDKLKASSPASPVSRQSSSMVAKSERNRRYP